MKLIIFILAMIVSGNSVALEQFLENKTVKRVFVEGSNTGGFYTNEGLGSCKYNLMYIDLSNDAGKAKLSLLLTAKASGSTIVRIDYNQALAGEACYLHGLHIE